MLTSHEPATVIVAIFAKKILGCERPCNTIDVV